MGRRVLVVRHLDPYLDRIIDFLGALLTEAAIALECTTQTGNLTITNPDNDSEDDAGDADDAD